MQRLRYVAATLSLLVSVGFVTAQSELSGTLEIWGWQAALDTLKTVDDEFAELYPNITLEYVQRETAATYQQIQLAVTAGAGAPDIAVIEDSHLAQFAQLGVLADITDRVEPYVSEVNDYKWGQATVDGHYYAMPWDSGPVAVFYRRDVFEQAGVDPNSIQTWEDYYQAAKTIKEETGVPMLQHAKARNGGRILEMLLWQRGLGYINEEGNVILDQDPRIAETLSYLGRFWEEDFAIDAEEWTDAWYRNFAEGKVATHPGAVWMGTFFKSFIAPEAAGEWGVFRLPAWEDSDVRASNDGGSALAMFAQSEQQEAAWAYIEFHLALQESQLSMYREKDIFPSLETTYSAPFFAEEDPYFGGQPVRELFAQVVQEIPEAGVYSSDYQEMNALLQQEIQRYALGRQSAEEALQNAASAIRERTRRQ